MVHYYYISREKFISILSHVSNKHAWDTSHHFHHCEHEHLDDSEDREWLIAGSAAHKALQEVILSKKLLQDVEHLSEFCHTGTLETYHSMMTKYLPKRVHFQYEGIMIEVALYC